MPAVRMDKMRRNYEEQKRGGEFWTPAEGDTKVYVHPPCRTEDSYEPTEGLNYIPVTVHYGVGKNNQMVVCTHQELNPIVKHPFVRALIKKAGKKLDGTCKVCAEIKDGSMSPEEIDRSKAQTRYLWGITPMAYRAEPGDEWKKLAPKPSVIFSGKMLYDGLMELYFDIGDISEMDGAVYAKIHREGKGKMDTRYKVSADNESLKKPVKVSDLPKTSRALAKACCEGGDCDLFKVVANMVKSPSEQGAILSGVKIAEDDSDDADVDEDVKKPHKRTEEDEADDEAEVDKPAAEDADDDEAELPKPKPKPKAKVEEDEGADEEPEAEADDEPAPKVKPKAKSAPVEDEEPEAEADDDEEPAPKPKPKAKPAPEPEEDEAEAEADEEPASKPKAKPKPEAEADGDEFDKLDAELDRLSKKKASAKK